MGGWREGAEGDKQGDLGGLHGPALGEMKPMRVVLGTRLGTRQTAGPGWRAKSFFGVPNSHVQLGRDILFFLLRLTFNIIFVSGMQHSG